MEQLLNENVYILLAIVIKNGNAFFEAFNITAKLFKSIIRLFASFALFLK